MIFRFALLQDKSIKGSLREGRIRTYCRKVTLVWCCFFILNGGIALITVFSGSPAAWSIYNGGVSYVLMGVLFSGEFVIRRMVNRKMPKAVPLSLFSPASRPGNAVLCYEGSYEQGIYKTWGDFLDDTAVLRSAINAKGDIPWVLHCEDCWYFLAAFTALLQCGREIRLTANISPLYLAEIRRDGAAFITDQEGFEDSLYVPSLLTKTAAGEAEIPVLEIPAINADETVILIYTSGTTGTPKAVRQRLREFENDNAFVLSKWGEEILSRKICSTVSQHHIYGLLFSILLPFTAGAPFRRRRLEYPEEFETLAGDSYMIITVPAFLKRAVKGGSAGAFRLKNPWIFTSGGVLPQETAEMAAKLFGFWPVEIYGSTETSGIAWRLSKDGPEWTPFDNVKLHRNEEGCLVIQSPYIRDPSGFVTGDLADILEDGRFLLRGRADSIVKIEEKRVSLPEVENRLLSSGFLSDVCVIALSGRRQYLAAALALNDAGKEKFKDYEKRRINRYFWEYLEQYFERVALPKKWRYLQALPLDGQGKKKKAEIEALFASLSPEEYRGGGV
jgi:acyl-coenzyme A synthetase/AMP-(fatty) acid ligase